MADAAHLYAPRAMTHQRVRELLSYDPETGIFVWIKDRSRTAKRGVQAGKRNKKDGYIAITVAGESVLAHRLAWFYVHGSWPMGEIDHRDGDRANNRLSNLRDVPRLLNCQNLRAASKANKSSGLLGAFWNRGRWTSTINLPGGVRKNLGRFDSPEEAHAAYVTAKRQFHEGCTL